VGAAWRGGPDAIGSWQISILEEKKQSGDRRSVAEPGDIIDIAAERRYFPEMASIVIRNIEDELKERLRRQAAAHGRSMEEEARAILRRVLGQPLMPENLAALARELFGEHGADLEAHPAVPVPEGPDLDA
jgi:plasmid stability protein